MYSTKLRHIFNLDMCKVNYENERMCSLFIKESRVSLATLRLVLGRSFVMYENALTSMALTSFRLLKTLLIICKVTFKDFYKLGKLVLSTSKKVII